MSDDEIKRDARYIITHDLSTDTVEEILRAQFNAGVRAAAEITWNGYINYLADGTSISLKEKILSLLKDEPK